MEDSMTILNLATEINHAARNIERRAAGIADALGGSHPECGQKEAPQANDLHSVLQRILTVLHETKDELARSEKVIGVCGQETKADVAHYSGSAAKTAFGRPTQNY